MDAPLKATPRPQHDIAIIGGGIVGLTAARLLTPLGHSVIVIDDLIDKPDGKSIVIGKPAANILDALDALPQNSRPIRRVEISFALPRAKRRIIGDGTTALGYGIDHRAVIQSLRQGLQQQPGRVQNLKQDTDGVTLSLHSGKTLRTRLAVITCAMPLTEIRHYRRHYRQTILSFTAHAQDLAADSGHQQFGADGVFVLVPRTDGDNGVILCLPETRAATLTAQSDDELSERLTRAFDRPVTLTGPRFIYTPQLAAARRLASGRLLLIGAAATTLHPIGARALNMGIADAVSLSKQIAQTGISPTALAEVSKTRQPAHRQAALSTSALALGVRLRSPIFRRLGHAAAGLLTQTPAWKTLLTE